MLKEFSFCKGRRHILEEDNKRFKAKERILNYAI
jgi:hypothetical protein